MISQNEKAQAIYLQEEKTRSLLQLQQVLRYECYEACGFWINRAIMSGATRKDISAVLANPALVLAED